MSVRPKISIVDYGVGNLHSLNKAVKLFTDNAVITEDKDTIASSDGVILPGVGAFEAGMSGLKVRNLIDTVKNFAAAGRPMLGICLGAQLMLSKGFEFGEFDGLGIVPGKVTHFPELPEKEKIPHIGWNHIYLVRNLMPRASAVPRTERISNEVNSPWENTILDGIPENANVYFVHSYILVPDDPSNILALANYGGYEFCAAIRKGNIYGCQFHPEKSGPIGLNIIKNFIEKIIK